MQKNKGTDKDNGDNACAVPQSELIERLGVAYGCYVDDLDGENCVLDGLDGNVPADCDIAATLSEKGLSKTYCQYWKPKATQPLLNKCPCCGHEY